MSPQASEAVFEDPVLRVRMLPAANREPVTVNRDDLVDKARSHKARSRPLQSPISSATLFGMVLLRWAVRAR